MGSTQSLFTNVDIMTTISLCFPRINTTLILENNKVCPKMIETTTTRHWRFKKKRRKEKKNEKNIYIINNHIHQYSTGIHTNKHSGNKNPKESFNCCNQQLNYDVMIVINYTTTYIENTYNTVAPNK